MKLRVNNFSSKKHRISVETGKNLVTVFYKIYDPEFEGFFTDRVFVEKYNDDNYCEKLEKALGRLEEYSGLELMKSKIQQVAV